MISTEAKIIRFFIIAFLLISFSSSVISTGERNAFAGPVLMTILAMAILCLYYFYNLFMNPGPDDPMRTTRKDYLLAVKWCCGIFVYLEILAYAQYIFLPSMYPAIVVSPGIFQGLALVPMAIFVTNPFFSGMKSRIPSIIEDLYKWRVTDPVSFWAFIIFLVINFIGISLIVLNFHGFKPADMSVSAIILILLVLVNGFYAHYLKSIGYYPR